MLSAVFTIWAIGIVIGMFITGIAITEDVELRDSPKFVAFAVFWPFALLITAFIGLQQIRGGSNHRDGLSRRQRQKVTYQRLLNDELERNMKIIGGK